MLGCNTTRISMSIMSIFVGMTAGILILVVVFVLVVFKASDYFFKVLLMLLYEPLSKLLVSPLITLVQPPLRSLDHGSYLIYQVTVVSSQAEGCHGLGLRGVGSSQDWIRELRV